MKLLIVEDNPAMRRLLRRMLADLVDDFTECLDGSNVIATYSCCKPDWVLMDIRLADMDGIAITRALLARFPDARVVLVTTYDDQVLSQTAQQAGACGYIGKEELFKLRCLLASK